MGNWATDWDTGETYWVESGGNYTKVEAQPLYTFQENPTTQEVYPVYNTQNTLGLSRVEADNLISGVNTIDQDTINKAVESVAPSEPWHQPISDLNNTVGDMINKLTLGLFGKDSVTSAMNPFDSLTFGETTINSPLLGSGGGLAAGGISTTTLLLIMMMSKNRD